MQLDSAFDVTAPIDEVWSTLMDFERVAACLPGAQVLNTLSEDAYQVGMKVKLGPVTMQYKGQLDVVERHPDEHRAVLRGKAKEARGQGTAEATAQLALTSDGTTTHGTVTADVNLSGRAAAMGQGVINTVTEQMMAQFSKNLQAMLAAGPDTAAAAAGSATDTAAAADAGGATQSGGDAPATTASSRAAAAGGSGAGAPAKKAAPRKRTAPKATAGGDVTTANGSAMAAPVSADGSPAPVTTAEASAPEIAGEAGPSAAAVPTAADGSPTPTGPTPAGPDSAVSAPARATTAAARPAVSAPMPAFQPAPADENALDAVALAKAIAEAQLREPKKALGLLAIVAFLAYLLGRRRGRRTPR